MKKTNKLTIELDDIFEDMNAYTGNKLKEDELFDRVKTYILNREKKQREEIAEILDKKHIKELSSQAKRADVRLKAQREEMVEMIRGMKLPITIVNKEELSFASMGEFVDKMTTKALKQLRLIEDIINSLNK